MKKKVLSLLLACALLSSSIVQSNAISSEKVVNRDVESIVSEYLTNLTYNMYMYEENNIERFEAPVDVLRETASDNEQQLSLFSTQFVDITEVERNLSYINDYAEFASYTRQAQGITRKDFEVEYTFIDIQQNGRAAEVLVREDISFTYTHDPLNTEPTYLVNTYVVELVEFDNEWKVTDLTSEIEFSDVAKEEGFDLEESINAFDAMMVEQNSERVDQNRATAIEVVDEFEGPLVETPGIRELTAEEAEELMAELEADMLAQENEYSLQSVSPKASYNVYTYLRRDNMNDVLQYARTYWNDDIDYPDPTGVHTWRNKNVFGDFGSVGGDCMNFSSQLVYTGFGGTNDRATVIAKTRTPLDSTGNYTWYGNPSVGSATSSFKGCTSFKNYLAGVRGSSSESGIVNSAPIILNGNSNPGTQYTSFPGSVMHVYGGSGAFTHAIYCTSATGNSWRNVYYYAHSPSAYNAAVGDTANWVSSGRQIRVHPIIAFREVNSCSSASHAYSSNSDATCNNCGYNRMRVRLNGAQNFLNITRNSTVNISGKAVKTATSQTGAMSTMTCYRLAMNVVTPKGASTWYEVYNASTITKSIAFSQVGIYTITIAARDINGTGSVSSTHTFTIRIT